MSRLKLSFFLVGAAKAIGFVESLPSLPNVGAVRGPDPFVVAMPIRPARDIIRV